MTPRILVLCCALFALLGCAHSGARPGLSHLYDRAAQDHGPERNPVVVVPGILGSRLKDYPSGRLVWGAFEGDAAKPGDPAGARLFALPMREGATLAELTDEVYPDGVLDRFRVRFLGLPMVLEAYLGVLKTLGVGGYRDEDVKFPGVDYGDDHFTCFQFPYDWRRDLSENAARFHDFLEEKRAYVEEEYRTRFGIADPEVKFDVVAHSMGGLLTRYYLRYGAEPLPDDGSVPAPTWAGADMIERVVLVGTPNGGSLEALFNLVHGRKLGPLLPTYDAALIGTFPAVYQNLPRDRHGPLVDAADPSRRVGSLYDPELWERLEWGLADPDQDPVLQVLLPDVPDPAERRRIALDHLKKNLDRARQLHAALDQPALLPEGVVLKLTVGDAVDTDAVASVDLETGELRVLAREPGDGTVLRSSALLDERVGGEWSRTLVSPVSWDNVTFLFSDHLGMTQDPHFTDNVLFFLLEQ